MSVPVAARLNNLDDRGSSIKIRYPIQGYLLIPLLVARRFASAQYYMDAMDVQKSLRCPLPHPTHGPFRCMVRSNRGRDTRRDTRRAVGSWSH